MNEHVGNKGIIELPCGKSLAEVEQALPEAYIKDLYQRPVGHTQAAVA